jgi:hypothetical protein
MKGFGKKFYISFIKYHGEGRQDKFLLKYVCKSDHFYLGRASYSQHCFDTNLSHPVFQRRPSANYMCAQDVHTTHIATNMENIKNNALLYIGT